MIRIIQLRPKRWVGWLREVGVGDSFTVPSWLGDLVFVDAICFLLFVFGGRGGRGVL